MYCNVAAESTGRTLACRLWAATDDPGMKDMLSFMIARDTMHQEQWLAVIEELGGYKEQLPIPNSFPQSHEQKEWSYVYLTSSADGAPELPIRATSGASLDSKGQFTVQQNRPMGQEPKLANPKPNGFAQTEQMGLGGKIASAVKSVI